MKGRMKFMMIQRIIAMFILLIPALISMLGWNMMKGSIYSYLGQAGFPWMKFIFGLIMFLAGLGFIGGFIFHRDGKKRLLQPRFMKRRKKKAAL
jgi:hypothetical protein